MAKQDLYTAPRQVQGAVVVDDEPSAEEKLKGVESWYQSNSSIVNKVLIGILAVVAGYFAYTKFYKQPNIDKANDAIFRAQTYFGMDSINWALNGDGNNPGFIKIIEKYGSTPAGNLAHYYAGVCFLKKGEFAKAEKHLKEFDGKGTLVAKIAQGSLGDAYMEQNKVEDAIKAYLEAANDDDNILVSPIYLERAAMAYEMKNNTPEAIKLYKDLYNKFPGTGQAQNAVKNLARLGEYNP
ncbi:MAG: tetratricopeptide repeat protein [Chitinophagaceae bacterium]|nr:tetratricopeptide repeat protein [Chitinophagaceae bacterium]